MGERVRVLIVDDSAYVRKVVRQMLSASPVVEVVGAARDGEEALQLVHETRPDVVTLDLNMPRLDGLSFLRHQMARRAVPVVILSATKDRRDTIAEAFDAGAVDVVYKPTALASDRMFDLAGELVAKVIAAARAEPRPMSAPRSRPPIAIRAQRQTDVVVIGVSTGGPQALRRLIAALPGEFPVPIAIVLHMPVGFTEPFARSLNRTASIRVVEGSEGLSLEGGLAVVAPAGYHMSLLRSGGTISCHLSTEPAGTPHRPAADVLFRSAAEIYGSRTLGVVMTGMGSDGTEGAAWIKSQGGRVLTEAEQTCVVYGMPRSVVEAGLSDGAVPLNDLARAITEAL